MWKQADVHAWSKTMSEQLKTEFPDLPDKTVQYRDKFDAVANEIREKYNKHTGVELLLVKMKRREHLVDNDLCGISPSGLLALVWIDIVRKIDDSDCYRHFFDTLIDMGSHCLQGDSHRLFSTFVALLRDSATSFLNFARSSPE